MWEWFQRKVVRNILGAQENRGLPQISGTFTTKASMVLLGDSAGELSQNYGQTEHTCQHRMTHAPGRASSHHRGEERRIRKAIWTVFLFKIKTLLALNTS